MAKLPAKPTVVPKPHEAKRELDFDALLSPEEQAAIRVKAKAKIAARDKLDAEEALLKQAMDEQDKLAHPETFVEMREIRIELALFADRVILDGRHYYAGEVYTVPKPVYDVLKEMERNTLRHEQEIKSGNTSDAFYRQERNTQLNWRTGAVANGPARF